MGEFLFWCLTAFVLLWVLGWLLNSALPRAARSFDAALDKSSRYFPLAMLPIEHTILSLLLGGLTVLIAMLPGEGPWDFIVLPATEGTLQPGVLLGSAAALLALLLFAATQVRNLEKDAGSGNLYLDENVDTFLARRSRVVRMLGLPVFHLAVSTLFIVPLVWSLLPSSLQTPDPGWELLPDEWAPRTVAIALWCASFGVVSGVLLLNVLNSLRNSTLGFNAPTGIERRIWIELRDISNQTYDQFFRGKHDDIPEEMYRWTLGRVIKASELPQSQALLYLSETIGSLRYRVHQEAVIAKCLKKLKKPERSLGTNLVGEWLASWLLEHRFLRAESILKKHTGLAEERTRAMLKALHTYDLTDEVRRWLIRRCITDATRYDRDVSLLLNVGLLRLEKREPTPRDRFLKKTRDIMLKPAENLPRLDGNISWSTSSQPSPTVALVPGLTFSVLATILFPRDLKHQGSKVSGDMLKEMLSAADGIAHRSTRDYALRTLINAVIRCVILTRADAETLPANILAPRQRIRRETSYLEPPGRKSRRLIIEEQAMAAMTINTDIEPDARSALLELLTDWRPPTALLFLLFYGVRAHRPLTAVDLYPFYKTWRDQPSMSLIQPDSTLISALGYLRESNISHFASAETVTWLFQSLDKNLNLELCVAFLKMPFIDFHLVQFVQWHVIASDLPNSYAKDEVELEPQICRQLAWAKPEIQQFAEDWHEVDPLSASKLHELLMRFPTA